MSNLKYLKLCDIIYLLNMVLFSNTIRYNNLGNFLPKLLSTFLILVQNYTLGYIWTIDNRIQICIYNFKIMLRNYIYKKRTVYLIETE